MQNAAKSQVDCLKKKKDRSARHTDRSLVYVFSCGLLLRFLLFCLFALAAFFGRRGVAELHEIDLAHPGARQSVENDDLRRAREARQIFAAKFIYFFNLFLLVLRLAVERDIELDYRLCLDITLNGASLGYPGDADDLFLDIGRIDIVARDNNKSLFAAGEEQETVFINLAEVAREHPAHAAVVGIDSACRLV